MLITLFSFKGSPGVTSAALALAASWQRPVTLVEADPSGGDLAYRCRGGDGGPVSPTGGLLSLAAALRGGFVGGDAVSPHAQQLQNGVRAVVGVASVVQSRGLTNLWGTIAAACGQVQGDVVLDAGRLDASTPLMPLLRSSDVLLPIGTASLESVMHLQEGLPEVMRAAGDIPTVPVIVGPDASGARDCADVDVLLARTGLPVSTAQPIPWDARALHRLEGGESGQGRLSRTLLLRSARSLVSSLPGVREEGVA